MVLERPTFEWIEAGRRHGSADEEAFRNWRFRPRVLADVTRVDTTVSATGTPIRVPIIGAPMGMLGMVHPDGEGAMAAGLGDLGNILVVAANAMMSIEQIAAAAPQTPLWFQLGSWSDRDATAAVVAHAEQAGVKAIVPLVNSPVAAQHVPKQVGFKPGPVPLPNAPRDQTPNPAQQLDYLEWLAGLTPLPIIPKGVMDPGDARRMVDAGMAGVIVSNHGGRQLPRAIGTLDALPGIVDEIGRDVDVYLDGGVRSGADVLVALALGARAVLVGNPLALALAVAGENGVRRAVEVMRDELVEAAALCGIARVADAGRDLLQRS